MLPSVCRVKRFAKDTDDTFTMEVVPSDADGSHSPRFSFLPGQFNMLHVFGVGEVPISISGDPASPLPIKHTTRIVGNVTRRMRMLKVGESIGLRGPFGSHWPLEEGKDVVIVAGGIGLAPLRPILYQIMRDRKKFRRVCLCYGTRSPADILFPHDFIQWASSQIDVNVTVDRATTSWNGNVGVVTSLIPRVPFDPDNALALVCGPEIMMRFTIRALKQRSLKDEDIYLSVERNMKCATGFCGHCQYGPYFVCKDGPVFRYDRINRIFRLEEI